MHSHEGMERTKARRISQYSWDWARGKMSSKYGMLDGMEKPLPGGPQKSEWRQTGLRSEGCDAMYSDKVNDEKKCTQSTGGAGRTLSNWVWVKGKMTKQYASCSTWAQCWAPTTTTRIGVAMLGKTTH